MSKQPYIPIYPGDELKQCGHLPLDVYGAYMKLRYKMWDATERGTIAYDLSSLRRTMGADTMQDAERIMQTLVNDGVLNIENNKLVHPEMLAAAKLSSVRKETGGKGGRKTAAKNKTFANSFGIANIIAKQQQNTENEIDIVTDNSNEIKEGSKEGNHQTDFSKYTVTAFLEVEQCLRAFMQAPCCAQQYETLCMTKHFMVYEPDKGYRERERLQSWGEAFNTILIKRSTISRTLSEWINHFFNWLGQQDLTQDPKKLFNNGHSNGAGNRQNGSNTGKGGGVAATAILQRPGR